MKSITPVRVCALVAATLALPRLAYAHSGSSIVYDCASGLAHPLLGWDHLAAMIAVGFWAAQLGGRARTWVPATFVAVMACAAWIGSRGFMLPGVEPMIGASVLTLGVLIAFASRLPIVPSILLLVLFGAAHGFAHGAEMPAGGNVLPYSAGFLSATIALHATGLLLGQLTHRRSPMMSRVLGTACAAAGVALLTF